MEMIDVFEIIGTVAFAISGAVVGIRKKMDTFGVIILSVTTAMGGGIIRDIMLNKPLPSALASPNMTFLSIFSALVVFYFYRHINKFENIIQLSDAIGLGAFTAIGARIAMTSGHETLFITVVIGVLTGTGGGVVRDVLANDIPLVFRKEIYASASIIGGLGYYYCHMFCSSDNIPLYIAFTITFVIRLMSVKLNLHLPTVREE
jgi:uncharacterized membrane protein YeiH